MAEEKKLHKQHRKLDSFVSHALLVIISIIWLLPFAGIVLTSFRSYDSEYGGMVDYVIPKAFSLDNYKWLFGDESIFLRWYGNTVIIALFIAIGQTCMVLMVSYTLSRMRFKGRELWMRVCLVLGMFPGFLTMICMYFLLKSFGLTQEGAIPGLILIGIASSGMGYYVCKGFLDRKSVV